MSSAAWRTSPAFARKLLVDPVERQQERAREDMLLDEIDPPSELVVARVRAGDELHGEEAVRLEGPVDDPAEVGQVAVPEGLDHLDRDDLVIHALDVPEIVEPDADPVAKAGLGDPPRCEVELLPGERHRGHSAAVCLSPPAAPNRPIRSRSRGRGPGRRGEAAGKGVHFSRPGPPRASSRAGSTAQPNTSSRGRGRGRRSHSRGRSAR